MPLSCGAVVVDCESVLRRDATSTEEEVPALGGALGGAPAAVTAPGRADEEEELEETGLAGFGAAEEELEVPSLGGTLGRSSFADADLALDAGDDAGKDFAVEVFFKLLVVALLSKSADSSSKSSSS